MTCTGWCKRFTTLITNAFRYNLIKGAATVKLIQAVLQLSGHAPWPEARNLSVETLIDFAVGIVTLVGVGQAHESDGK